MLHNIILFICYTIETFISFIYYNSIAKKRYSNIGVLITGFALFGIGAIINLTLSNIVMINTIYHCFCNWLFFVICYDIKKLKALFHSIILDIVSMATEFASIYLVSAITKTDVKSYLDDTSFFVIDITISKVMYFILVVIMIRFIKKDKTDIRIPVPFYLYPFIVLINLFLFWSICANNNLSNAMMIGISLASITTLASIIILFLSYQFRVEKENEYLQIQNELEKTKTEKNYYDILEKQNQDLMIYAHDTKNHLSTINELNSNPEIDKYLSKMIDQLRSYSSVCHSGNHMLDVIINKYVTECKLKSIKFDFDVRHSNINCVDDFDLVSILGNALDNALESAKNSEAKQITLVTGHRNTYDFISITNSCDNTPKSKDSELFSTKQDHKIHGYGIKSIKKSIIKYNGDLSWNYDKDRKEFSLDISLLTTNTL